MEKQFSKIVIKDYNGNLSQRWYIYFKFEDPDSGKMRPFKFYISQKYKTRTSRYNEAAKIRDTYKEKITKRLDTIFQIRRRIHNPD